MTAHLQPRRVTIWVVGRTEGDLASALEGLVGYYPTREAAEAAAEAAFLEIERDLEASAGDFGDVSHREALQEVARDLHGVELTEGQLRALVRSTRETWRDR